MKDPQGSFLMPKNDIQLHTLQKIWINLHKSIVIFVK